MRSDHTATEFAQPQPMLATPFDGVGETAQRGHAGALARITFCFAWLFGLEPFLTGAVDEAPRSRFDRH